MLALESLPTDKIEVSAIFSSLGLGLLLTGLVHPWMYKQTYAGPAM